MVSEKEFQEAVLQSKTLKNKPSDSDQLALYSYYKQATKGDNDTESPGGFDFVAKAKYDAWKNLNGMTREVAMTKYVEKVNDLNS